MDVHDETGARLRSLLEEAGTSAVPDVLVEAALVRAGRVRRRRTMARGAAGALGSAALVAGLVVGVPALGGGAGRTVSPAASRPSTTERAPSEVDVARALFPAAEDLAGLRYRGGPLTGHDQPAVAGPQSCDPTVVGAAPGAVGPVDVATMDAVLPGVTREGVDDATFTVSAWADSRGWQQVVADTGRCRWVGVEQATWPGGDRPDRLLLVGQDDPRWVVAVRRVGSSVVGVSIHRSGSTDPTEEAVRLVGILATNVAVHGWPGGGVTR